MDKKETLGFIPDSTKIHVDSDQLIPKPLRVFNLMYGYLRILLLSNPEYLAENLRLNG